MNSFKQDFTGARKLLEDFISDEMNFNQMEKAGDILVSAIQSDNKIFSCGNGGSMCDAMHFAEELTGRFKDDRRPIPAISISDPSHITCVANDYGFDYIFSRYIDALGSEGDILLAISTSGNSPNVVKAAESAKQKKMKIISLTGKSGGILATLSDIEIRVPHNDYSDRIQEIHIKIIHSLINYIEQKVHL
jgi:D-sedoheptulose 7-phosphate isomerase